MDQQYPTVAKIPILDTGKFEQWQFRIQQYLQHEHYALWEVIEYRDSYEVPTSTASTTTTYITSGETGKKSGRTVTFTAEDMQKKKNDVKERTTLLLSLPDEHQLSGNKDGNTACVPTASTNVPTASASVATISQDTACAYIASQSSGKKISIQGSDMAGFDKSKFECFNCHKMGHFARECRAPRSQDRGRRDNYRQGSKAEEQALKALMAIDGKIETLKQEKEGVDRKLAGLLTASKDLDNLIESQRADKNKEGLGYNVVPPPLAQIYSSPKKDLSWTGLPEFADDIVTDYSRPSPTMESTSEWSYMANDEEDHALVADEEAPTKFALMANTSPGSKVFDNSLCSKDCKKNNDSLNSKITDLTDKLFDAKNMIYHYKLGLAQVESRLIEHKEREIKYCEKIRGLELDVKFNTNKFECIAKELETLKKEKEGVDGKLAGFLTASMDLDNLIESQKSDKNKEGLGYSVVPPPPAQIYSSSKKDLSWTGLSEIADNMVTDYSRPSPTIKSVKKETSRSQNNTHKSFISRPDVHKPYRPLMRPVRTNMNGARPNKTSFNKPTPSYTNRPFQRTSAVRSQYRAPCVPTVNRNFPPVNRKFSTGNSQNNIDDKGYWDSGCSRHMTCNISYLFDYEPFDGGYVTPRQHNMYSIDLNNIVPHKDLTCLVAKASADEFRGLPTKCFENDHTCTACLKGKQHKASCKSILVNSVYMDFFLKTKNETSGILRKFITEIENLKDLKVKIIRCDNGGEFRNKEMNDFCSQKGIKREFNNVRTPQQNGVAKRRNRTLIEAARTMLADAKLPVTFWAEAVNTACYV
nr:hypothetical protein [Tanacetum cinerariifolium]